MMMMMMMPHFVPSTKQMHLYGTPLFSVYLALFHNTTLCSVPSFFFSSQRSDPLKYYYKKGTCKALADLPIPKTRLPASKTTIYATHLCVKYSITAVAAVRGWG